MTTIPMLPGEKMTEERPEAVRRAGRPSGTLFRLTAHLRRLPGRLHANQSGSISLTSVLALMLLTVLLGMVVNSGQQIDQKVKMQNAADAASYSAGIVLARSMNTLAFTNHLLSDVFALTAYLREAKAQGSRSLTPEILLHWRNIAPILSSSEFPKFADLGQGISEKVPVEEEMVRTFSEWAKAASDLMLPVTEMILEQQLIPQFQRDLVRATPQLAQYAMQQVARRHGEAWPRPVELQAALWRTIADPVGGASESDRHTLPVVDPVQDALANRQHFDEAVQGRSRLAHTYLNDWNDESLLPFDKYGKMSRFSTLWRSFTCGQLKHLLEDEYPDSNLPHVIRTPVNQITNLNQHLEQDFMFVGVVYRSKLEEMMPSIFSSPVEGDTLAYAQIMLFVPTRRLMKVWPAQGDESDTVSLGGVPGQGISFNSPQGNNPPGGARPDDWVPGRQFSAQHPDQWDLWTQNWTTQMVPATAQRLPEILSTQPQIPGVGAVTVPNLTGLAPQDMRWLSNH